MNRLKFFTVFFILKYHANKQRKNGDKYCGLRKILSIITLDYNFKLTQNLKRNKINWKIRESEKTAGIYSQNRGKGNGFLNSIKNYEISK